MSPVCGILFIPYDISNSLEKSLLASHHPVYVCLFACLYVFVSLFLCLSDSSFRQELERLRTDAALIPPHPVDVCLFVCLSDSSNIPGRTLEDLL